MERFPDDPRLGPAFRALARTIVPDAASLTADGWAALEAVIARALRDRPAALRRQLGTFIRLLNILPVLRWGRTFERLDATRRTRFLRGVERAPLLLVRRGFWGLRTLVFMGYYGRPEAHAAIGYTAALRGWLEHPAGTAAARARLAAGGAANRAGAADA